jgi:hypothetical protein
LTILVRPLRALLASEWPSTKVAVRGELPSVTAIRTGCIGSEWSPPPTAQLAADEINGKGNGRADSAAIITDRTNGGQQLVSRNGFREQEHTW